MSWVKMWGYVLLIFSSLFIFMVNSWFLVWVCLELNLLSFCYISGEGSNISVNSVLKYFLIQGITSILFFFCFLVSSFGTFFSVFDFLINMVMLFKLGGFPFFFWVGEVGQGLSEVNLFLFLSWQKLMPLTVMMYLNFFLELIIIMTGVMGVVMMINQSSMKKFLVYSSLVHLSWIMFLLQDGWWVYYMLGYLIMMYSICWLKFEGSILQEKYKQDMDKLILLFLMFNLSGLPPFLGFIMKLFILKMYFMSNFFLIMILLSMSLVSCYVYMIMVVPLFLMKEINGKFILKTIFYEKIVMLMGCLMMFWVLL